MNKVTKSGLVIAAAAAALFLAGCSTSGDNNAYHGDKHHKTMNGCKGDNSCKGKNACKGKNGDDSCNGNGKKDSCS